MEAARLLCAREPGWPANPLCSSTDPWVCNSANLILIALRTTKSAQAEAQLCHEARFCRKANPLRRNSCRAVSAFDIQGALV